MIIKKQRKGKKSQYDMTLRNTVCLELLSGNLSITEAKAVYGIKGQGTIYGWLKDYQGSGFDSNLAAMNSIDSTTQSPDAQQNGPVDDLQNKNKQLEAALNLAKLKITALETMIDIAESELNIDIRKKSGTKQ